MFCFSLYSKINVSKMLREAFVRNFMATSIDTLGSLITGNEGEYDETCSENSGILDRNFTLSPDCARVTIFDFYC